MQIQAFTYMISFFFRPVFPVCMWPVFVCIVCILLYDVARYMSHTIELVCVCMCLYCLYVYVFFGLYFAPDVQVRFLGREKLLSVLATKSKKIVLRWLAIACMCLYCMYMTVLCVSSVSACIEWIDGVFACIAAAHTIITAMSPNDRLLWLHQAGLTQGTPGHGRQYFFTPSLCPPATPFRAPPPSAAVGGPWTTHPTRLGAVLGRIRACWPRPKPHHSLLGKLYHFLRHRASATAPQRPLPTVIGTCMYVSVYACIACICIYLYVYVYICMYCLYVFVSFTMVYIPTNLS